MAAEIAGLLCAAVDRAATTARPARAATYQSTAQCLGVAGGPPRPTPRQDRTATATTSCGSPRTAARTPARRSPSPTAAAAMTTAPWSTPASWSWSGSGSSRANASDITNTLSVVDSELEVQTPEGPIWHRYNFDGYGETSSGGDYTGVGRGQPVASADRRARRVRRRRRQPDRGASPAGDDGRRGQLRVPDSRAGLGRRHRHWRVHLRPAGQLLDPADVGDGPVRAAGDRHLGRTGLDTPAVVAQCLQQGDCPVQRAGEGDGQRDGPGQYRRLGRHRLPGRQPFRAGPGPVRLGRERDSR